MLYNIIWYIIDIHIYVYFTNLDIVLDCNIPKAARIPLQNLHPEKLAMFLRGPALNRIYGERSRCLLARMVRRVVSENLFGDSDEIWWMQNAIGVGNKNGPGRGKSRRDTDRLNWRMRKDH